MVYTALRQSIPQKQVAGHKLSPNPAFSWVVCMVVRRAKSKIRLKSQSKGKSSPGAISYCATGSLPASRQVSLCPSSTRSNTHLTGAETQPSPADGRGSAGSQVGERASQAPTFAQCNAGGGHRHTTQWQQYYNFP